MQPVIEGKPPLGCHLTDDQGAVFRVWAPRCETVAVHLVWPDDRLEEMKPVGRGYFELRLDDVEPRWRYYFRLDGQRDRPDPASRLQPKGVHGPSAVVPRRSPQPVEGWRGLPLSEYIIYEIHPGTFTDLGTLDAATEHLDHLVDLGITAVELMPVAAFPGGRNWGYDGVYPFAVDTSYGGPDALERFVRACHQRGLAVVLDVVYNHLGPEGNYLHDFGPYFTDRYRTPWGDALNFDGHQSDHVRRYFLQNAAQWIDEFGVDALRLDAVHAIYDKTSVTFLEELRMVVEQRRRQQNRHIHLIAETNANDPSLVRSPELGGLGMDAQWSDDFHHAVHAALTGERQHYYCDYGSVADVAQSFEHAYVYTGQHSEYRGRRHGMPAHGIPAERFVVAIQNHDQIGNRPRGSRLSELVNFEQRKLAACALLLSPYVPLLFMGEEYGEPAPFPYFVSHGDPELLEAVRRGRRQEFCALGGGADPPDPAAEETFWSAKIDIDLARSGRHCQLWQLYKDLIERRRALPSLAHLSREDLRVTHDRGDDALAVQRWYGAHDSLILLNFAAHTTQLEVDLPPGRWMKSLESADARYGGPGARLASSVEVSSAEPACFELAAHSAALFDAHHEAQD